MNGTTWGRERGWVGTSLSSSVTYKVFLSTEELTPCPAQVCSLVTLPPPCPPPRRGHHNGPFPCSKAALRIKPILPDSTEGLLWAGLPDFLASLLAPPPSPGPFQPNQTPQFSDTPAFPSLSAQSCSPSCLAHSHTPSLNPRLCGACPPVSHGLWVSPVTVLSQGLSLPVPAPSLH